MFDWHVFLWLILTPICLPVQASLMFFSYTGLLFQPLHPPSLNLFYLLGPQSQSLFLL